MEKISARVISALLFVFSMQAMAADQVPAPSCTDVTKLYYDYDKGLPGSASNQVFPQGWQDVQWLLATLGATTPATVVQKIAVWKKYNYMIVEENGVVVNTTGQVSTVTPGTLISQAMTFIGAPDVMQTNHVSRYTWSCDNNSSLTVASNDNANQAITQYKGTYCSTVASQQVCQNFSNYNVSFPNYRNIGAGIQTAFLYIQHPPTQPQYTDAQADAMAKAASMQAVKALDKSLADFSSIQNLAMSGIANFYNNLQHCTPGTYQYVYPFILGGRLISSSDVAPYFFVAESKIQGIHDGKCTVTTNAKVGKNNGSMNCQYTPQDLQMFTPEKAMSDAQNSSNFDMNKQAQTRLLLNDCQAFFNGSLITAASVTATASQ